MLAERREYDTTIDRLIREIQLNQISFQTYTPSPGERWDTITGSLNTYGNPYAIEVLKRFNRKYATRLRLGPDTPLRLPNFKITEYLNLNSLPPWDERRQRSSVGG